MSTRRLFLKSAALGMFGVGAAPAWLSRALYAADAPSPRKKILVAIFQRGAVDGLNVVVPFGEKQLLQFAAESSDSQARRHGELGHRSGRFLRLASRACAAQAHLRCAVTWPSSTRLAHPIPRARISTRRITWNLERRAGRQHPTAG